MLERRETIYKPEEVYIHAMIVSVPRYCGLKGRIENGS
jgi:hypothetical protein